MEIGDQLYLYRQQARHHTSDVVSPILADIALTMCVGFYVLWRSGSKKPDHTARQSRNQKAGKHILAGITPEDNVFARRATNMTISNTEVTEDAEDTEKKREISHFARNDNILVARL